LRETEPDYSIRNDPLLRVFCLWVLPADEALAHLARDRAEYVRHLEMLEQVIAGSDWGADPIARAGRLAIEFGRRFYTMQIEWIDWAAEQVAAGTLEPGGPLPGALTTSLAS
jgi:hypothetical protein